MKSKVVVGIVIKFSGVVLASQVFLSMASQGQVLTADAPITKERTAARTMFIRLTGVIPAIDSAVLDQMEAKLKAGDKYGAAAIAIADPNFLDIVVRNMATAMSNVDEQVTDELSDFSATIIGVTRDNINAKELLTGNYIYTVNTPASMINDVLKSNNNYVNAGNNVNFSASLVKRDQLIVLDTTAGTTTAHPEPAGLLTSRKFGLEHLTAGTNRRAVRYTFKEFLCRDIQEFADAAGPDNMVGKDVDRFPAGDNLKFQSECKTCHTMLDGMRPAFAHFDFADSYVKSTQILANGTTAPNQVSYVQAVPNVPDSRIVSKYFIHADIFPGGYAVSSSNWINNATRGINANYFGWRGTTTGSGIQAFASMIANSEAYSQCFTKRVFKTVCNRDASAGDDQLVSALASQFETNNYNIKALFRDVAAQPECLGE